MAPTAAFAAVGEEEPGSSVCPHDVHDAACGCSEGSPCTFDAADCEICRPQNSAAAAKQIPAWSFVDPDGYLTEDGGAFYLSLSGVSEETPVSPVVITSILPAELTATVGVASAVTCTITATAGAGGEISTGKYVCVGAGESAGFTFIPHKGYQVADVLVKGKSIGAVNSYVFTDVRANQSIHVTFKAAGHVNPQTDSNVADKMFHPAVWVGLLVLAVSGI